MDDKLNISPYYLRPGFAFGGSCLPKDLKALNTLAHDLYIKSPVIENINISNELQKNTVLDDIIGFEKQKLGFLGLSFKAGTDDLRNSPIVEVIESLLGKGYDIKVYDRNIHLSQLIGANKEYILQKIPLISRFISNDINTVVNGSEVIIVVNNEPEFKNLIPDIAGDKIVYDLINIDYANKVNNPNYRGLAW
jgi:GDP-mannose 6-dehydrogenase